MYVCIYKQVWNDAISLKKLLMHLIGKYSFVTHFSCSIYVLRGKSQCYAETKKETEFVETSQKGFMKSLPFWKNYNLGLCYDQKQNPKISNRKVHCPRLKKSRCQNWRKISCWSEFQFQRNWPLEISLSTSYNQAFFI